MAVHWVRCVRWDAPRGRSHSLTGERYFVCTGTMGAYGDGGGVQWERLSEAASFERCVGGGGMFGYLTMFVRLLTWAIWGRGFDLREWPLVSGDSFLLTSGGEPLRACALRSI